MFESIEQAPPDAILGLAEAFRNDTRPNKINLTIGVYQNEDGRTEILNCVKAAERKLLEAENSKSYLGIDGFPPYCAHVPQLLLGESHEVISSHRYATLQTPGGTGALRVAADLLHSKLPTTSIWCSKPTWANHHSIFQRAGLQVNSYDYLHADGRHLDFDRMTESLQQIPAGDAVCLHACCHNPTGVDPTRQQWETIAQIVRDRKLLPVFDAAYQGFGGGLEDDAWAIRHFAENQPELMICSSYSKNFGLYGERVGALTIVTGEEAIAKRVLSQAKACVRANYSNPPKHGAAIVALVLGDAELRQAWVQEVADMCSRIRDVRQQFVARLREKAEGHDFSFILKQNGMFSYSGLTAMQVDQLRSDHAIYIVGSGRINVAGINRHNVDPLCDAIAAVLN